MKTHGSRGSALRAAAFATFAGASLAAACITLPACSQQRAEYPTAEGALGLSRVILYRNGIGYFERTGKVSGDVLTIKVRKDQVNDLLKSLTVVEREGGKAVSVSMPLDPGTWANAALATLAPGRGSLAEVLDSLRGTEVVLTTTDGDLEGRIAMVERADDEHDPARTDATVPQAPLGHDYKVTLLQDGAFLVTRLSKVSSVTLKDGDLAMQFERSLDATAGEGMFQQVDVAIRLVGASSHDLLVSYVVAAPMWKPTYRVVLPENGKGKALLQGWAVVDNTSGEDWRDVVLGLTAGAPIAFRYDLHTPRNTERSDLTETGVQKRAEATVGEATYADTPAAAPAAPAEAKAEYYNGDADDEDKDEAAAPSGGSGRSMGGPAMKKARDSGARPYASATSAPRSAPAPMAPPATSVDFESLRRSTQAAARATAVSGLNRFDLSDRVTVPDGTSTMVAVINQEVQGEETFLYKPGGAGQGYEQNPYRVVRFRNSTPFVLEPGPIAIYAGGSFVGEGLSEAVGTNTSATIPFAVEPGILVTSSTQSDGDEQRVLRVVRGIIEAESFARTTTKWTAKAPTMDKGLTVLVRHSRVGYGYELKVRPEGTEDLPSAYLIPLKIPAGAHEATLDVVEQTPSRVSIGIYDGRAIALLESALLAKDLTPAARAKLEPIVKLRQDIGRIDTQIDGLRRQQEELNQRADETRRNLEALKKDRAAGELRARQSARLEQFTLDGDKLGRQIVELNSKRLELKINLDDTLQELDLSVAEPRKTPAAP